MLTGEGPTLPPRLETAHWGNRFTNSNLGELPVPLPTDYLRGIDVQWQDFEQGWHSYLRGEWRNHGWWYYYLYALAVKVPLGSWVLVVCAGADTPPPSEQRFTLR